MRILHLIGFVNGAPGRAVTDLAIGERRVGHSVSIVTSATPVDGVTHDPSLLEALAAGGITVHQVDSLVSRHRRAQTGVVDFVNAHLGTAAAFDVLHTHGTVPSVIAIASVRHAAVRVPILQTTHEWTVTWPGGGRQAWDLEVMNLVDRAVVPSWSVAEHFAARGVVRRQLAVVPYGVPPEPVPAPADHLAHEMRAWREAGGLVLCYVSATTAPHDHRLLRLALPFVDPRMHVLCVVFGGPETPDPAPWPADGPVTVRVAPHDAAVRRYSHEADVLVLPSGDGEQPLAVLEAFCDEVPVVASRVPELSEFIEDGQTGWLFDPADPRALAATLHLARTTAPHAVRALCQRARVRYQSEFTVDRMVSGYLREYARLA